MHGFTFLKLFTHFPNKAYVPDDHQLTEEILSRDTQSMWNKSNLEYSPEIYWKESFCASSVQGGAYNYGEFWEMNQVVAALVSFCYIVPEKSAEIPFLP